jgi:hypothetical protein
MNILFFNSLIKTPTRSIVRVIGSCLNNYQPVEFVIQYSEPTKALIQSPGCKVKVSLFPLQLLLMTTE